MNTGKKANYVWLTVAGIAIANAAKARAYDVMSYLFSALIICFGLMQVDLAVILLLVAAFLFVEGVAIYQMVKLEKKM